MEIALAFRKKQAYDYIDGPLGGMVDAADLKSADSICRASSSLAAGTLKKYNPFLDFLWTIFQKYSVTFKRP